MSKEEVPGEKRTTSPGVARPRARSTASASEIARSQLTAPSQERLMLGAISPIRTADLTFSFTKDRSGSKVSPLSLPPAISTIGFVCAASAFSTASRLVAFESFTYPTRSNFWQRFSRVDDCDILFGLVFENPQLGRAVVSDRAITIEMVGSEVEPETDRWAKRADCFQLKRAHFNREHVEQLLFTGNFGERFADVATSDCSLPAGIQHLRQQFGRCG